MNESVECWCPSFHNTGLRSIEVSVGYCRKMTGSHSAGGWGYLDKFPGGTLKPNMWNLGVLCGKTSCGRMDPLGAIEVLSQFVQPALVFPDPQIPRVLSKPVIITKETTANDEVGKNH